ncbi:unnamed protein product [Parascedosporium putredinis]|uniref:Rad21/Rec8-like protein N-terminal domain-containing protein n=1 Tax=Parascedosporium putredinis TaxID=1442378 RepID=A0A9P1GWF7_9PEZI|nr:unnamed protein product [Parascedosporium putredinis]CAI7988261.1 unnamed protein product [Parascedosporium putredinis]
MFYSHEVLTNRQYGVATIWWVATLGRHGGTKSISRKAIKKVQIKKACEKIIDPGAPLALRLQSNLLYGVTRVYSEQCRYVLDDAEKMRSAMVTLYSQFGKLNATDPKAGKASSVPKQPASGGILPSDDDIFAPFDGGFGFEVDAEGNLIELGEPDLPLRGPGSGVPDMPPQEDFQLQFEDSLHPSHGGAPMDTDAMMLGEPLLPDAEAFPSGDQRAGGQQSREIRGPRASKDSTITGRRRRKAKVCFVDEAPTQISDYEYKKLGVRGRGTRRTASEAFSHEAENTRRVRRKTADQEDQGLNDEILLPEGDDVQPEVGRRAHSITEARSSSGAPWSRQGSMVPGSSVKSAAGRRSRQVSASPLVSRGTAIADIERFNDQNFPADDYAGGAKDSGALDFDDRRNDSGHSESARRWVAFDRLAEPGVHDRQVAAQAFHHTLVLATKGEIAVRQHGLPFTPFGKIEIGINIPAEAQHERDEGVEGSDAGRI